MAGVDLTAANQIEIVDQEEIDVDDLLRNLGGFAKFQAINVGLLGLVVFLCAFSEVGYVITSSQVAHRCLIPECESANSSWSSEEKPWLSAAIPTADNGDFDSCLRFAHNVSSKTCDLNSFTHETYQCHDFVYESEEWTVQREDWNIHCDGDTYWLSLIGSLNNAGQVIGSFHVGYITDWFGRKAIIVIFGLTTCILGIIKSFSVNYTMMAVFEVIEGSMNVALFNGAFVLALEIVDPSHRVLAGAILTSAYAVGEMILGAAQWLTLDWRTSLRILYAPYLLIPIIWWLVPESVRWLMDNRRPREAVVVLEKMAKMNRRELPVDVVKRLLEQGVVEEAKEKEKAEGNLLWEMLRSKRMRLRVVASLLIWMCSTFVYFGMTYASVGISSDKFLNFILNGLIEIFGNISVYFVLDRAGRKICLSSAFFLCGVACFIDGYIPTGDSSWSWAVLAMYLIGKFGASIAFFVVNVYTTELFPTAVRATMMSLGLLVGKAASIVAPEVPLLGDVYGPLPLLLFGAMATSAGFLTLTFPETLNTKLPDTVEEAENLGHRQPSEPKHS